MRKLIAILFIVCVALISCKDSEPLNPASCLLSMSSQSGDLSRDTNTYTYDAAKRLIYKNYNGFLDYSYEYDASGELTAYKYYHRDSKAIVYTDITYTNGKPSRYVTNAGEVIHSNDLQYDNDQLTSLRYVASFKSGKISSIYNYSYTYSQGNLIEKSLYDEIGNQYYITTYEYDLTKENKKNIGLKNYYHTLLPYADPPSKNLLVKATTTTPTGKHIEEYSYKFDQLGLVSQQVTSINFEWYGRIVSQQDTIRFTYHCK